MTWLIIFVGALAIVLGLFKQVTKMSAGYQIVNVPGYVTMALGIVIALVGVFIG